MSYREVSGSKPLVIAAFSGRVFGLDPATGRPVWGRESDAGSVVRMAVDGELLFTLIGGVLECLERATGKLHWELNTAGETLVADDGVLYVAARSRVWAISYSGEQLWDAMLQGMDSEPVAIAAGNQVAQVDLTRAALWRST
ncbi:MAG: PQQ-binding-like beta-propeller repeat protein [Polyangiaceae bacterium]